MPKNLLFFCSYIILLLTRINLSLSPIISKKVGTDSLFGGKSLKCTYERYKGECHRKKAVYNLEYSPFINDI